MLDVKVTSSSFDLINPSLEGAVLLNYEISSSYGSTKCILLQNPLQSLLCMEKSASP